MSLIVTVKKLFSDLQEIKYSGTNSDHCFKYTAMKDKCPVNIKLFFEPRSRFYNNYVVESQIYISVLSSLRQHTSHIPVFFGIRKTDISGLDKYEMSQIQGCESKLDIRSAQVVACKNLGGETLRSMWIEEYDNPHIAFQVLYTIACFERVGLKHNDLHLNNIFVENSEEPYEFNYEIDGEVVSFVTTKRVKIIDYDRSSIYNKDVERNGYLDDLQESEDVINQFNGPNNGHDTFKFLRGYKYSFVRGQLKTWLKFECPSIFEIECSNDLLGQDINPPQNG